MLESVQRISWASVFAGVLIAVVIQIALSQPKQEAEVKTREVADQEAKAASTAAILTFISLVLGAGVASYGAKRGNGSKENTGSFDSAAYAG